MTEATQTARDRAHPAASDTTLAALADGLRTRAGRLLALALVAAAFAYRELVVFEPTQATESPVDEFFFGPSTTAPLFAIGAALCLAAMRWRRLRETAAPASPLPGGLLVTAAVGVFAWARLVAAPDLLAVSLFLLIVGGAWLAGGGIWARTLFLPALVLLFAIPQPAAFNNQIVYWLQMRTAELSTWMLNVMGIEAVLGGDRIYTANGVFQVIESCSGLRSIETLVMSAVVYAELFYRGRLHALLLAASAPFVAFVLNAGRVVTIATAPTSDVAESHTMQGILALVIGVFVIAGIELLLRKMLPAPPPEEAPPRSERPIAPRLAVLSGVGVALAAASLAVPAYEPASPPRLLAAFPPALGEWQASGLKYPQMFLGTVGATEWTHRAYERGDESVTVFLAADDRLNRFRSLLSDKHELPGSGWTVDSRRPVFLEPGGLPASATLARAGGRVALSIHWYEGVEGVVREAWRGLSGLDRSPLRRPGSALVARLTTEVETGSVDGLARAEARLRELAGRIRAELARTREIAAG